MENRTQPILCCVGADVAGEPTQFLMERAALAGHWDWHVITVEVSSEELATAWAGMHVMRFQAVRFFPTHHAAAMHLVAKPSRDDLFIGGVTSAMRTGDEWSMWHNSGPALVDLLASRIQWDASVCWVHGNSAQARSFLVACRARPPRKIYWTGAEFSQHTATDKATDEARSGHANSEQVSSDQENSDQTIKDHATQPSNPAIPEAVAGMPLVIVPAEREGDLASQLMASEGNAMSTIVHVGEMDAHHLEQLVANQPEFECGLAIVSSAPGSRRKLNLAWRSGEVCVISPADLVIAEEAYDQARWTGQTVNMELLREAYEEYVDF